MSILPCKECIVFPMCKSKFVYNIVSPIINSCEILQNFIYSTPPDTSDRYKVLNNLSQFYFNRPYAFLNINEFITRI